MNIEDVTTIEELVTFMDEEAVRAARVDSDSKIVNGAGIQLQWSERLKFPVAIYYLLGGPVNETEIIVGGPKLPRSDAPRLSFEIKSMHFDSNGNKTEKPQRD